MSAVDDVDELIEQFHLAQGEFIKGNPEPCKRLLSHLEDVSLNRYLFSIRPRESWGGSWQAHHREVARYVRGG
jgi:hypothetical protein